MGANNHTTVTPDGGEEPEPDTVFVVVGVNKYPDDGFKIFRSFDKKALAEAYIEAEGYKEEDTIHTGWSNYYVKKLPNGLPKWVTQS